MRVIAFDTAFVERRLPDIPLTIMLGPLKGKRWLPSSGFKFFGGNFEPDKTEVVKQVVRPGDTVYDLGAHVGYYSVLMSSLVGPTGRIFSFEPNPRNLRHLKKHISMNGCTNVRVFEAGVGGKTEECRFETRCITVGSHISSEGNEVVKIVKLDDLIRSGEIPIPDVMKIDVEGAELEALNGARSIFEQGRPRIIFATHSDELEKKCTEFLVSLGYKVRSFTPFDGDKEFLALPVDS